MSTFEIEALILISQNFVGIVFFLNHKNLPPSERTLEKEIVLTQQQYLRRFQRAHRDIVIINLDTATETSEIMKTEGSTIKMKYITHCIRTELFPKLRLIGLEWQE